MLAQTTPSLDSRMPDAELVRRIVAGEEAAFRLLMKRHNQALYRTARSILRDDAEAEDALQDAYLQAFRSMDHFRGDAKLSTWLTRIVVNVSLERLRKTRRSAQVIAIDGEGGIPLIEESNMGDENAEQPEREALRAEARRLIERSIDALPDAFRTVFMLRGVEEMSVEEASAALGIPEATVRTRFFRARALMRASLSHEIDVAIDGAFSFDGERCDRIVAGVMARLNAVP
jgi:RNA polymerase sigma-70 factor (ECF subfamily)